MPFFFHCSFQILKQNLVKISNYLLNECVNEPSAFLELVIPTIVDLYVS